jgi:Zn-dependent protease with chaperone function
VKGTRASHLARALVLQEQSHRRAVLLGIGALLVLGTSPVVGHHLVPGRGRALAALDHLGPLCLTALHLLLAPVHEIFHALLVAGIVYAAWERFRAWRALRAALSPLSASAPVPGDPFWQAAARAALDPRRVRVVDELPSPAFTAGWLRPRVYVARTLAERLSASELAAVFAHEGAHLARRDPLRLSLVRALACVLFWIPALRRLADDVADEAEVQADDAAAREHPLVLASALLALSQWLMPRERTWRVAGFTRPDLLERRIRRLAGELPAPGTHLTRRSLVGAALALALVWTSGLMMAHPLPAATDLHGYAAHCEHHHAPAFRHLFCLGLARHAPGGHCPHAKLS